MQNITVLASAQLQVTQNNTLQLFQKKQYFFYFIYSQVTSVDTGDRE